jgi:hypothetical protein
MSRGRNLLTLWRNRSSLFLQYVGNFLLGYTVLCPLVSKSESFLLSEYSLTAFSHSMLQVKMMTEHGPLTLETMSTPHTHLAEMRVAMCFRIRMMSSESQLTVEQR